MDAWFLWAGVVPGLVIMGGLLAAFAYYMVRVRPEQAPVAGAKASGATAVVPQALVDFFYTLIEPVIDWLGRRGVTPNQITVASLVGAVASAVLLGLGYWLWGAWVFALSAACDGLDGMLARRTGRTTASGAFFDSVMDRFSEGIVLLGVAVYGQGGWLTWSAVCALIASYGVSYARARGEALGVDCTKGAMQRPERMVVLFVAIWGSPYLALYLESGVVRPVYHLAIAGTILITIGALWTSIVRARFIFETLRDRERAGRAPVDDSLPVRL
jgi:CDP-diacylglycerol---glycerol-3-phosphate 3-phosphatidyltransferase